jgi:bacterioferritin-associated ferredoxin
MKNSLSDKYICSCKQILNKEYENYTLKYQKYSFEKINKNLGVASTCGACLLNAELLFLKLSEKSNTSKLKNDISILKRINSLNFLSHNTNYFKKKYIHQIAPILTGKNITTDLIISNIVPKGFEKHTVPFRIKYKILDANGKTLSKNHYDLKPYKRLNIRLNTQNNQYYKSPIAAYGSIWLKMIPLGGGYLGLTRPHIRVSSSNSISTIHLQHGRKKETTLETSFINKNEIQFLSVVNLENKDVNLEIKIKNNLKTLKKTISIIKPYESKCINLTNIYNMIENNNDSYNKLTINHKGLLRRNIIIYNQDPEIISIDHV